jgi:hypothetical protein
MSCFVGRDWECVLRWKRPPEVAPERMPKADATGLALQNHEPSSCPSYLMKWLDGRPGGPGPPAARNRHYHITFTPN